MHKSVVMEIIAVVIVVAYIRVICEQFFDNLGL